MVGVEREPSPEMKGRRRGAGGDAFPGRRRAVGRPKLLLLPDLNPETIPILNSERRLCLSICNDGTLGMNDMGVSEVKEFGITLISDRTDALWVGRSSTPRSSTGPDFLFASRFWIR